MVEGVFRTFFSAIYGLLNSHALWFSCRYRFDWWHSSSNRLSPHLLNSKSRLPQRLALCSVQRKVPGIQKVRVTCFVDCNIVLEARQRDSGFELDNRFQPILNPSSQYMFHWICRIASAITRNPISGSDCRLFCKLICRFTSAISLGRRGYWRPTLVANEICGGG